MKPNSFKALKPMKPFKWVMNNCIINVTTEEQQEFIDSPEGRQMMNRLLESKSPNQYWEIAYEMEEIMALLSGNNFSISYQ